MILLIVALPLCLLALGLWILRFLLNRNAEPGTSLKLTDLLLMGSACWARGTRMDLEWRREMESNRILANRAAGDWSAPQAALPGTKVIPDVPQPA